MLLRGRSKDRISRKVTPPSPSYMSNEQFADYLADLRNSRVARPSGARPLPSRSPHDYRDSRTMAAASPVQDTPPPRTESATSHRRAQSAMSNLSISSRSDRSLVQQPLRPTAQAMDISPATPPPTLKPSVVVASATYIERGQRWMEKEDAFALREALEDMDVAKEQEEEARLHAAAQDEASDLVWQHQHPKAIRPEEAPYKYKEYLRKNSYAHARTQSVGPHSGVGTATGLARDMGSRTVSGGSSHSGAMHSQSRVSSGTSYISQTSSIPSLSVDQDRWRVAEANAIDVSKDTKKITIIKKPYHGLSKTVGASAGRRRSSGKRNISGEPAGNFDGGQIWEEPTIVEESRGRSPEIEDLPAPLRLKTRNPLSRVQFAQDAPPRSNSTPPERTKKFSRFEIHQNPPSQSRNPIYTSNAPSIPSRDESSAVTVKGGLEVRSDEIREATSMKLIDRSPKLPMPSAVSDRPGRPIVSFDANWMPEEADLKPVKEQRRQRSPFDGRFRPSRETTKGFPVVPHSKAFPPASNPAIHVQDESAIQIKPTVLNLDPPNSRPIQATETQPVPVITFSDAQSIQANRDPSVPTINFSDVPSIQVIGTSPVPTISTFNIPQISVSRPAPIPSINISQASINQSARALPNPKTQSSRPIPRHFGSASITRGHWSPAPGNRATATCHQCDLPIGGRVVALRDIAQRFHPQCFICYTCGTGLEALEISPEPAEKRMARLDRIRRRGEGEYVEEVDGQTEAEDGDKRLRFYCHLDWHELFAPRCKHCTTPIIGEHAVALGEHWHYGHFFCAECGDPFEQGMTHIEKDGYAWCLSCQTKRTERKAPKCMNCRKPVIGQYIQALGGEFHDGCFKCGICSGGFDDGQIFPQEDGSVLCTACMERELKA